MSRQADLEQLIALGEGQHLEFKRSGTSHLGREICAMANSLGGRILIGVDDQGRIIGANESNRFRSEIQSIARNIDPPLTVDIEADTAWYSISFARPVLSEQPSEPAKVSKNEGLNEGLNAVLQVIQDQPGLKAKEIAANLGNRPIKTVERHIKILSDKGLIERRGSRKTGGYWRVADEK